jgi:6-phosphogluconolactonase (cycloisomerase 2 family)
MLKVKPLLTLLPALLISQLLTAQTWYVFAGSYNFEKNKTGIYVYRLDTLTGHLTRTSVVDSILNPSWLTISPDGSHLYAGTETQTSNSGSVTGFAFDSTKGKLIFINKQSSPGENPVYISIDREARWLVDANYGQGSIAVYPLSPNGFINPCAQFISFTDSGVNKQRQDRSHIHSAIFSPAQDYMFFPDLGADKIRSFSFDPAQPKPLLPAPTPYTATYPGGGPRHLVFNANGKYAYLIEEMGGSITVFHYANGRLDSLQRIATHSHELKKGYGSADIHISPDGLFLYASNRNVENNIAIFAIDQQSGRLTAIGYQSVHGRHPRNFAIDPTGNFLLVANQFSSNVTVFRRNKQTGLLKRVHQKVKIPGVSCLQVRRYN